MNTTEAHSHQKHSKQITAIIVCVVCSSNKKQIPDDNYLHKDYQGSIMAITAESGAVRHKRYDPWGVRKNPETWDTDFSAGGSITARGYTMHEHLDDFGLINMNGRIYDPLLSRFLSPDNYIQSPDNPQNYNRYAYALNNPLKYTDPSGEFLLSAIVAGAFINTAMQDMAGNIDNFGDFILAAGVGAASGAAGGFAGHAVAGILNTATTFGSAVANGAITGASSGFAGGFVSGAGNAWIGGANLSDGMQAGIIGGGHGALFGTVSGAISGGIQYQRQFRIYQKGCEELGVNGENPVPKTDEFLSDAQQAWYEDAPMKKAIRFTVENVPKSDLNDLVAKGARASTIALSKGGILTGNSYVYFNENLAFNSAKTLFFTMGHELVHVSQFAALANQSRSLLYKPYFDELLDYHAYSYQNSLGGLKYNSFSNNDVMRLATQYPNYFKSLNYMMFNWTHSASFKYPF